MATLETTNISNEIKVTNDLSYYNEQLALKHATDAENSANKAKSEADKASASAGDVESSANRAKSEADKASASAGEAKSILNSAATTITNTKNSAISAIQAEGNTQRTSLQGYVDNAKSYANSASASASTATTKASEIVTSANNAKTYMTNAQSYMNTAKTYQDNALSYKNSAQTSASVATEQANLAKQYASSVDKESINISKMYTTGAVSTDTQGYNQLVEMKRSTFDKSKFTVVGNPTITDNGVASGFGSSNDLLTTYIFNPSNTWKIKGSFITPTQLTNSQVICAVSNTTYSSRIEINSYNSNTEIRFGWHLSSNNASYMSQPVGSIVLQFNTQYFYEWSFDGTQYRLRVSTDNKNWQISAQYTSSENIYTNNSYIRIGKSSGPYQIFTGSIDLSQFSITVDGKEVFSGNKTGIDTIKADNYEVVGSPVISNDGVLSNCTYNADYVSSKQTFNLHNANTWEIQCHYNPMGLSDKPEFFMFYSPTISSNGLHLGYRTKSTLQLTVFEDGNKIVLTNPNISLNWESYTDYLFKVRFTGTQYLLDYSKDNGNTWIKLLTVNSNKKTVSSPVYVRNGVYGAPGIDYGIKIGITDLNQTKVYIDGNLVYQPCLKIPYTQSKTGSKIVDCVYRDRVQDMYEQYGYAPYYTLDETNKNFTLPMGEIYGMIERKSSMGMPIGTVFPVVCTADYVPDGALPCDGAEYTKAQFKDLWDNYLTGATPLLNTCSYSQYQSDIDTYGQCPKFAVDTVNGKFKVQKIKDGSVIQQALSDSELGKSYNDGLPNITGTFASADATSSTGNLSGAMYKTGAWASKTSRADYGEAMNVAAAFNASRSSSIYGNSDTVQPNAVALRYFVQVANGQINQSMMDWSAWASGLQGKLNADHSNDTKPYIVETYVNGTSGYITYSDDGVNGKLHIEWGRIQLPSSSGVDVNLFKEYKNTDYNAIVTSARTYLGSAMGVGYDPVLSTTTKLRIVGFGAANNSNVSWQVSGYIS